MLPISHQVLHGPQGSSSRLPLWCAGGASTQCPRSRAAAAAAATAAAAASAVAPVDLIQWPQGTRPKRGSVTKAALTRLKVNELRAELARLGADSSGSKEQLADKLLEVVTAAAAAGPPSIPPEQLDGTAATAAIATAAAAHSQTKPAASAALSSTVRRLPKSRAPAAAGITTSPPPAPPAAATTAAVAAAQQLNSAADHLAASAAAAVRKLQLKQQERQQQQQQLEQQQQVAAAAAAANRSSHTSSSSSSQAQLPAVSTSSSTLPRADPDSPVQPGCMPPLDLQEAERVAAAVGVRLEDLPPLSTQSRSRGLVYRVADLQGLTAEEQEIVLKACRAGLVLTLLGASGDAAAGDGPPPCVGLLRERDIWLWDVGEDAQRALLWREHLKPSKMHRIVITRQSPDAMLGLPGVLCVLGASREKGHEAADIPIHVFAPEGAGDFLNTMYECSDTFLEMPVVIHEFVMRAVPEELQAPQPLNTRAKLWRALMPPDQLNPDGFIDGDLEAFMPTQGRARFKKGQRAAGGVLAKNPRAGYRPFTLPPPGDPTRTDLHPRDMTWTIRADEAALMTAVLLDAPDPSWGVVWREADKQGNLSIPRCQALDVNDNSLYQLVKNGESVPNDNGITIPAPMLCSPDKPGRKMVLLPPCSNADNLARHAASADVMYGAVGAATEPGQQLGLGLGRCAQEWGVRHLVVTGLPGNSRSNGWLGKSKARSNSSSSSSIRSVGISDSDSDTEEQEDSQVDPAVAAVLSVVSEQYTAGQVIRGRESLSLIVEENLGTEEPPPIDLEEKTAEARATALAKESEEAKGPQDRRQQPSNWQQRPWNGRQQQQQQERRGRSPDNGSRQQGGWQQQQQRRPAGGRFGREDPPGRQHERFAPRQYVQRTEK